ncbi:MAG: sugar transferase [Candidatus Gottesmanbacteria bacterium]|nr:sugar transferase [Candidatus Gottesmanbacteria bacterium]
MKKWAYRIFISLLFLGALPVMGVVAILIRLIDGSPVLYRQRRVGLGGKPFTMVKFRTMKLGAEQLKRYYLRRNQARGPVFKMYDDPRFTRLGKFLSHVGLDELPQLVNVVRGEMALFGPRPLPSVEAKLLKPWMRKRHAILPGIISPWIFEGYHSRPFDEWMRSDIAYTKQKSVRFDLKLLGKAVMFVGTLLKRELIG